MRSFCNLVERDRDGYVATCELLRCHRLIVFIVKFKILVSALDFYINSNEHDPYVIHSS